MKWFWLSWMLVFSLVGMADASYLTWEHFSGKVAECRPAPFLGPELGQWVDCGEVLTSAYATIGPVPVALLGLVFYLGMFGLTLANWLKPDNGRLYRLLLVLGGVAGLLASLVFVYLQLVVLESICLYCMVSAGTSLLLMVGSLGYLVSAKSGKARDAARGHGEEE